MSKILDRLVDAGGFRIETILWPIACGLSENAQSEEFETFVEEVFHDTSATSPLWTSAPFLARIAEPESGCDPEEVAEAMLDLFVDGTIPEEAVFFRVATPVRRFTPDLTSSDYNWGRYDTEWLYAPRFSDVLPLAEAWVARKIAEMKAAASKAA